MSSRHATPRAGCPEDGRGRVRAYLRRFFTCWVAEDPAPGYSRLDRADGLGTTPDPLCTVPVEVPESVEVIRHWQTGTRPRTAVGGRAGL